MLRRPGRRADRTGFEVVRHRDDGMVRPCRIRSGSSTLWSPIARDISLSFGVAVIVWLAHARPACIVSTSSSSGAS
ncbi:MAG: hypothetical protein CL908_06445 [Deltaproteobacteria bacterium]|nr:hypothetical protein [Deltaproteobacteria bacterium]